MSSRQDVPRAKGLQRAGQIRLGVRWNRISPQDLVDVLSRSIARALGHHASDLPLSRLRKVRATAVRLFVEGVRGRSSKIRALPKRRFLRELDRNRNRLLVECDQARAELLRLESTVEHLREDMPEPTATNPVLDRELDEEMEEGVRRLFKRFGYGGRRAADLQEALVGHVLSSARAQRWAHLKDRLGQHRKQIDLLERRITKLSEMLARTEKVLHQVIQKKQLDEAGIASIYREVQGLSMRDEQFAQKQEMLRDIFEANVELRRIAAA